VGLIQGRLHWLILEQDLFGLTQLPVLAFEGLHLIGLSAILLEALARFPLSTSALLTQSYRVCGAQPIFDETDGPACRRDPCWP